jgi:hypothetical protein
LRQVPNKAVTEGGSKAGQSCLDSIVTRRSTKESSTERAFDDYRETYNGKRPHEALGMEVPLQRYRVSVVSYPERLPGVECLSSDKVYKASKSAHIQIGQRRHKIGKAFIGQRVALRPKTEDGCFAVWFSRFEIGEINMRTA